MITFRDAAGQTVLSYLRSITCLNVMGPKLEPTELVHLEGQRYLTMLIETRMRYGQERLPRNPQ